MFSFKSSSKGSSSKESSSKKSSSKKTNSKKSSSKASSSSPNYFAVYLAKFELTLQDPDVPGTQYHHLIYVETKPSERVGMKFHVVGDITRKDGMKYQKKEFHSPSESTTYNSMEFLGYTAAKGFERNWDDTLKALPTPPKQKEYNISTGKTELVKCWEPLTFYAPGEKRHVPWKCSEWTIDYAIPALYAAGYIIDLDDDDESEENDNAAASRGDTSAESGSWIWDSTYSRHRRWSANANAWVWAPEQ